MFKHHKLDFCLQVMQWAHIWWWFLPFCLQTILWFQSWKNIYDHYRQEYIRGQAKMTIPGEVDVIDSGGVAVTNLLIYSTPMPPLLALSLPPLPDFLYSCIGPLSLTPTIFFHETILISDMCIFLWWVY